MFNLIFPEMHNVCYATTRQLTYQRLNNVFFSMCDLNILARLPPNKQIAMRLIFYFIYICRKRKRERCNTIQEKCPRPCLQKRKENELLSL